MVQKLLEPLIGLLCWIPRQGHGTGITIEFGEPHLSVQEPMTAVGPATDRVRKVLSRRRVFIVGDWHLWIRDAKMLIETETGYADNQEFSGREI